MSELFTVNKAHKRKKDKKEQNKIVEILKTFTVINEA